MTTQSERFIKSLEAEEADTHGDKTLEWAAHLAKKNPLQYFKTLPDHPDTLTPYSCREREIFFSITKAVAYILIQYYDPHLTPREFMTLVQNRR